MTETQVQVSIPAVALRQRAAAKALGVSERTLATWTKEGLVPHVRLNGCILYPVRSLEEWLVGKAAGKNLSEGY